MAAKKETEAQRMRRWEKEARAKIAADKVAEKKAKAKVKPHKDTPEERLKKLENFVWNIKWRLERYKKKDESFFPEDIEQDLKDYKLK